MEANETDNGQPTSPISVNLGQVGPRGKKLGGCEQSQITVKQFLDFLKTAYQVHDNLEGILKAEGMMEVVDWIKLKETCVVQSKPTGGLEGDKKNLDDLTKSKSGTQIDPLSDKLNEILTEGIADSVLSYLVPSTDGSCQQKKASILKAAVDKVSGAGSSTALGRRKSQPQVEKKIVKTDSEVEIHVCDETKGQKKDFVCNQQLLVEQMGYFADVTKDQKLDDMDISVHCDVSIFDWLMRWVKRDNTLPEDRPELEVSNAVPILVSAAFLQMEPLLQECLYYCHQNMNDILKTTTSLSCLNDTILTRLAAMYTNTEVEQLRDRKDKIQSRLFCKLIQSLCEPEPESIRGHYCSISRLYRCKFCQQLINPAYGAQVPCSPCCMSLQPDGSVVSRHVRDSSWDLNDYIVSLHKTFKTWRKVYWKLWGSAHFLYCLVCKRFFSARQEGWCRFHPDHPQFFTLDAQKPPLPIGRYPCCGERAYRFQLLDDRSGCYFRNHAISTKDVKDASIAGMVESYRNLIAEEPPQLVFPDRLTRLVARATDVEEGKLEVRDILWWDGFEIVPPRGKLGLLGAFGEQQRCDEDEEQLTEDSDYSDEEICSQSSSESMNSPGSEESSPHEHRKKVPNKKTTRKPVSSSRLWQSNLSTRSNQDLQRAYEESAFKQMSGVLNNRTSILEDAAAKGANRNGAPAGGVWVRLESEWREKNAPAANKSKNIYSGKVRMKTTRLL